MNTWRNGCFRKMDDLPVHNTPNHQPLNMDVLTKTSLPLNGQCSNQVRPPNSSDDICLLFCINPSSMSLTLIWRQNQAGKLSSSENCEAEGFTVQNCKIQENLRLKNINKNYFKLACESLSCVPLFIAVAATACPAGQQRSTTAVASLDGKLSSLCHSC